MYWSNISSRPRSATPPRKFGITPAITSRPPLDLSPPAFIINPSTRVWRGSSAGQSVGFITPRSGVQASPPLPIFPTVYGYPQWWPFFFLGEI